MGKMWCAVGVSVYTMLNFARHCSRHRNFQLSTRILHDIFEFSIIWINDVNATQFSTIVELRIFDCPVMLFFTFRRVRHIFPQSLAIICRAWRSFVSLSVSSPGPCTSIRWFFIQKKKSILRTLSTYLTILDLHQRFDIFSHHYIQRCMCSPCYIDAFQWNKK